MSNLGHAIDQKVETIQERNARVEAEKAWETSWTRRTFIMITTYVVAGLYMQSIGVENPWLGALVPTLGYFLSTLSIPFIKIFWLKKIYKTEESKA